MSVLSNISLPSISEEELTNGQSIKQIMNYLAILDRQIKYAMYNIDPEENFTKEAMENYREATETSDGKSMRTALEQTANHLSAVAEMTEGNNSYISNIGMTATDLTASISSKVGSKEIISKINMTPEEVKIQANKINLMGAVSVGSDGVERVKIDGTTGKITAVDGEFSGTLKATKTKVNDSTAIGLAPGACIYSTANISESENGSRILQCLTDDYINNVTLSAQGGDLYLGYKAGKMVATNAIHMMVDVVDATGAGTGIVSDRREKEDIEYIPSEKSLNTIKELKPASFKYIGKEDTHHGFIAQDIDQKFKMIMEYKNEHGEDRMAVIYTSIIADLVGAVQELSKKVELLERRK